MFGRTVLIVLLATTPAFGQKGEVVEKEVRFARGESSAVVKGIVEDRLDSHIFHVQAKAGQTMNVQMISPRPLRDAYLCVNYPLTKTSNTRSDSATRLRALRGRGRSYLRGRSNRMSNQSAEG
jgi:hypothetical protein